MTYKNTQLSLLWITASVLLASFYLQYFLGLNPCPLCIMQRVCLFILLGLLGLSLKLLNKARIICVLQISIASIGLYFALRQLWLQSLPAGSAPACMPGMDVLLRFFPWQTVAHAFLWGSADCAEIKWTLLGISIPGWAGLYFFLIAAVSFWGYLRARSVHP